MGQAALLFEVVIGPVEQFGHAVRSEEFRPATQAGVFPGRGLGAVLAELQRMPGVRFGPGAADAGEALDRSVLPEQGMATGQRRLFTQQNAAYRMRRTPAAGRLGIGSEFRLAHACPAECFKM